MCGHRCPRHRRTFRTRDGRRNGAGDTPCLIGVPVVGSSPDRVLPCPSLPATTGRRISSSALWKPASALPAKTGRFSLPGDSWLGPLLAAAPPKQGRSRKGLLATGTVLVCAFAAPSESSPRGTPNQAVAAGFRSADKIGAQARSSPRGTAADFTFRCELITDHGPDFRQVPRGELWLSPARQRKYQPFPDTSESGYL